MVYAPQHWLPVQANTDLCVNVLDRKIPSQRCRTRIATKRFQGLVDGLFDLISTATPTAGFSSH
jgi:hypothetical protein